MGCGASNARGPTVGRSGERYVHLKHLEKSVALSGKVAAKIRPHRKEYAVPLRGEGDDATEIEDTRSSYLTVQEGDTVSATQHLLRFLTTKGESESSADRPLSSLGNLDELSKAMLSVNAGTNQIGALRVQLRTKDPNSRDPDGDRVPLHWAAARGHTKCAMVLLRAGADPQLTERASGLTCSELADERGHTQLAVCLRGFAPPSALSFQQRHSSNGGASVVSVEEEAPADVLAAEEEAAAPEAPAPEAPAPEATVPVEQAAVPLGGQAAMWLALEAAARQGQPARMDGGGGRGGGGGGRGSGSGGRGAGAGGRGSGASSPRHTPPSPRPPAPVRRAPRRRKGGDEAMWLEAEQSERMRVEVEVARRGQPTKAASTASPPDDAMWLAWEAAQRGLPFEVASTASAHPPSDEAM